MLLYRLNQSLGLCYLCLLSRDRLYSGDLESLHYGELSTDLDFQYEPILVPISNLVHSDLVRLRKLLYRLEMTPCLARSFFTEHSGQTF